jgi:Spy/CpxP family protein refolding chaperone
LELTFDAVSTDLFQEVRRLQGLAAANPSSTAKAEFALVATPDQGFSNMRLDTRRTSAIKCIGTPQAILAILETLAGQRLARLQRYKQWTVCELPSLLPLHGH